MLNKKEIVKHFLQEWYPEKSLYDYGYDKHEHDQDSRELLFELANNDLYLKYIEDIPNEDLYKIFKSNRDISLIESFDPHIDKTLLRFYKRIEVVIKARNPKNYNIKLQKFKDLLEKKAMEDDCKKYKEEFEEKYGNHPDY